MFCITERPVGDVMILRLKGTLAPGDPEIAVRGKVEDVAYRGYRQIILDLAEVSNTDAAIISALLQAREVMRDVSGDLKLLHATTRVTNLLILVALQRHFVAFESESEALGSLNVVGSPGAPQAAVSPYNAALPWSAWGKEARWLRQ